MKKITITAILLVAFIFMGFAQTKIGTDLDADAGFDEFGQSVAMSDDGSIIAVGTNAGYSGTPGYVKVLQNNSGTWTQLGSNVAGDANNDNFGTSVALSADGTILAVGAIQLAAGNSGAGYVKVFKNNSGTWTQLGSTLVGDVSKDQFGYAISLSADGTKLAVGAPQFDKGDASSFSAAGQVKVFEYAGSSWTQLGPDILGADKFDKLGWSVSLSNDGSDLAVGIIGTDVNNDSSGSVNVYEFIGTWSQVGYAINGVDSADTVGNSVSISGNGNTVAVSAYKHTTSAANAGSTSVYENVSGTWTQVGADMDGAASGEYSGYSISLSDDGSVLAIGAYFANSKTGLTRVYENVSGTWFKLGSDILGEAAADQSGKAVAISGDGNTLAIGAFHNAGAGSWAGHARVYDLSTATLSSDSFVTENATMYPNPASDTVTINLTNGLELEQVNVYNTLGQLVKSENESIISVNTLAKGSYFFEMITNKGKATKMIIVK